MSAACRGVISAGFGRGFSGQRRDVSAGSLLLLVLFRFFACLVRYIACYVAAHRTTLPVCVPGLRVLRIVYRILHMREYSTIIRNAAYSARAGVRASGADMGRERVPQALTGTTHQCATGLMQLLWYVL
jgi:hypothetical protein